MILLLAPLIAIAVVGAVALLLRVQRGGQRELVGSVVEPIAHAAGRCRPSCISPARRAPSATPRRGRRCARSPPTIDPGIEIREIDIAVEPELARRYRVMSLPTTIVLDADGQVTDINVGFASGEVLRRQLVDAGMPVAA